VQRNFSKNQALDYWESGMDMGLSREMFDSFLKYQSLLARQFQHLQAIYGFHIIDGNRSPDEINAELKRKVEAVLTGKPERS
jgi:dTMP kinase